MGIPAEPGTLPEKRLAKLDGVAATCQRLYAALGEGCTLIRTSSIIVPAAASARRQVAVRTSGGGLPSSSISTAPATPARTLSNPTRITALASGSIRQHQESYKMIGVQAQIEQTRPVRQSCLGHATHLSHPDQWPVLRPASELPEQECEADSADAIRRLRRIKRMQFIGFQSTA